MKFNPTEFSVDFYDVALFTRAWIEIRNLVKSTKVILVALFTRAWIEISTNILSTPNSSSRPLYEGVD